MSEYGTRIRAHQGHSIEVDLALSLAMPPTVLFHGTATRFVDSIRAQGLKAGPRQHVHLSTNHDTAVRVGQRHGKSVVCRCSQVQCTTPGASSFFHKMASD